MSGLVGKEACSVTSVGTDAGGALSREAPAATLGRTVSQLETSDIRTGLWQLHSALRGPSPGNRGLPGVTSGRGHVAAGGGRRPSGPAPPHPAERERDVSRRPGSPPPPWSRVGGHGRNHRFLQLLSLPHV